MRGQLVKFLKDHLGMTIVYFLSNVLLGIFYSMSTKQTVEILYPFLLSGVLYVVYMIIKFYQYQQFEEGLENIKKNVWVPLKPYNNQTQEMAESLEQVKYYYEQQLSEAALKERKQLRFLSSWIHNMKTPITVIDLLLQRMETNEISYEKACKELKEENVVLLHHLEMILHMLRLQEFSKDYDPEQVSIMNQIEEILNKNKRAFIYNGIVPKLEYSKETFKSITVMTDSKWNELVVNQIISNAIKYSAKKKGVLLHIGLEDQKDSVILHIQDEGIGIPAYDLDRIYEPFFTGENGRKGYHSTGIGLYICKEVCDKLGHPLQITSKVGQGTTVSIQYPKLTKLKGYIS